jgi:NADH-quinone oxidoreductase subunit G
VATDTKERHAIGPDVEMVTLTIDGQSVTVPKGTTVLEAAEGVGIHIPTFCWHPKLKSVGSCRMCYVEIEKMRTLMVSCATTAMNDMVVHTDSDAAKRGRKAVLEFILANHPLDCPTCDKGGECDLQDLTLAHGVDDSRFDFLKHRFREEDMISTFDDLRIGPEIILNRNRCILCYKCVRANKEAFGEYDLGAYERGNMTQITPAPGRQVDNPFSGNLVEICPVGALTNSDWRYKIRVWLTQIVPSICPFYSSGVTTLIYKEDSKNKIHRVTSRPNDDIDDGWLSDVTRYGYQVVTSDERLQTPLIKKEGKQISATWDEALTTIQKRVDEIISDKGRVCLGGLVAPRLDNATMHSFNKFIRKTIGSNNVDYRNDYRMLPVNCDNNFYALYTQLFRIADIDDSDVIVAFGSDMIREHPNEYLRIRKAVNFNSARVFSLGQYEVKSADVAHLELIYRAGTAEVALNALCLAALEGGIADAAVAAEFKSKIKPSTLSEASSICGIDPFDLKVLAMALADGKKVTFLAGQLVSRSSHREAIASAMCNVNHLFGLNQKGQMAILPRYSNSRGAWQLGLLPEPHPAIQKELESIWGPLPEAAPCTTDRMILNMKKEEVDGFFVMGANPAMLYPDQEFAREGLERLDFLVVCDMFETETTALADVVLPLSSWAEYAGEYVNLEGRVQGAEQVIQPRFDSKPGHEIVAMMAERLGTPLFESDEARDAEIEQLLGVDTNIALPAGYSEAKYHLEEENGEFPIPLFTCDDAHHYGHLTEKSNSLVNLQGEAYIEMSPDLAAKNDVAEGDSVRVESPVGKIIVPVRISDYVDSDVVIIPRNFSSTPVTSLLMRKKRVDRVKINKVAD